jgi:N-acetylgalactosamine-6-sulfatase
VHLHFGPNNESNQMGDWLDPKAPSIARLLKQAGYRTGHFGKWHLTNLLQPKLSAEDRFADAPLPAEYGFDEAAVWAGPGLALGIHQAGERAARFIKENKNRPFYLNVWLHESHTPHIPTAESMAAFSHLDEVEQIYAAVIADGDRWVGQVLEALEAAGVADKTIVIFSSDNGPEERIEQDSSKRAGPGYGRYYSVGKTGGLRGQKRSLYEGGVRVPFIVRWPGKAPEGQINDSTVLTAVDLYPTFAAAAGVSLPEGYKCDGENVLAAFRGKDYVRSTPVFWEWRAARPSDDFWPSMAVREGDWKLVQNEAGRIELYQLPSDRAEAKDVAAQHPERVDRLKKMLAEWKAALPTEVNPETISKTRSKE